MTQLTYVKALLGLGLIVGIIHLILLSPLTTEVNLGTKPGPATPLAPDRSSSGEALARAGEIPLLDFKTQSYFSYPSEAWSLNTTTVLTHHHPPPGPRAKACFVILVRNKEIHSLRYSIQQLEDRFNHRYHYPYVILNDEPITPIFKRYLSRIVSGNITFGVVPEEHWSYPPWINQQKAAIARVKMRNIIYGGSESYRHMCRFNSGFFYRHPLMADYDYYWRVEPGVQFTCEVDYDPFVYMQERKLKYGFAISMKEIPPTVTTLWATTQQFMREHRHLIPSDNTLAWVAEPVVTSATTPADDEELKKRSTYNMCHFWSNFEIASLAFYRSPEYQAYFDYLDRAGGFFYERWGDAPVHSLAAAMFLQKDEIHWFHDIGYIHGGIANCPIDPKLNYDKCFCSPVVSSYYSSFSCTKEFEKLDPTKPLNVDDII